MRMPLPTWRSRTIERQLPDYFIPRYSMVMFHSDIPYAVAQQRGTIQKQLVERLTSSADSLEQVDMAAAVKEVQAQMLPIDDVRVDRSL